MAYSPPHKSIIKIIELTAPRKYKEVEVDEFLERHEILSKKKAIPIFRYGRLKR